MDAFANLHHPFLIMGQTTNAPSAMDGISLVPCIDEPRAQELCVMSFVVLLAGEPHKDRPSIAFPAITAFVIMTNNAIKCDTQQTLKPLPQISSGRLMAFARTRLGYRAHLHQRFVCAAGIRNRGRIKASRSFRNA